MVLFSVAPLVSAQVMESSSYKIERDSINVGGGLGSSENFSGESTVGESATGRATSASYILDAGYQQPTATSVTPPAEEEEVPPSGGGIFARITSLQIIEGSTHAIVRFTTSIPVKTTFTWGTDTSYGFVPHVEERFLREHIIILSGLSPETRYFFNIEGQLEVGFSQSLLSDSLVTLSYPDGTAPSAVRNLQAVREGNDIKLTWRNPYERDFSYVRVFGSSEWYPDGVSTDERIYEGSGEETLDLGRAIPNTTRYYTVYSYDAEGNASSGAIVAVTIGDDGEITVVDFDTKSFTEITSPISLQDLRFIQNNEVIVPVEGTIVLDGSRSLLVMLPYDSVPEHLKSIVMTIESNDGSGNSFSFLLRVNDAKTAYTAVVAPLGMSGTFPFAVSFIDYKVKQVGKVEGMFTSRIPALDSDAVMSAFLQFGYAPYFFLLLLALLIIAYRLIRGPRGKKNGE